MCPKRHVHMRVVRNNSNKLLHKKTKHYQLILVLYFFSRLLNIQFGHERNLCRVRVWIQNSYFSKLITATTFTPCIPQDIQPVSISWKTQTWRIGLIPPFLGFLIAESNRFVCHFDFSFLFLWNPGSDLIFAYNDLRGFVGQLCFFLLLFDLSKYNTRRDLA